MRATIHFRLRFKRLFPDIKFGPVPYFIFSLIFKHFNLTSCIKLLFTNPYCVTHCIKETFVWQF